MIGGGASGQGVAEFRGSDWHQAADESVVNTIRHSRERNTEGLNLRSRRLDRTVRAWYSDFPSSPTGWFIIGGTFRVRARRPQRLGSVIRRNNADCANVLVFPTQNFQER